MRNLVRVSMLLVALYLVAPAQAMAQGMDQFNPHPYIGVGLGAFGLKGSAPGYSQSNTEFGGYVNAGINFNDYLGVELRLGTTTKGSKSFPPGTFNGVAIATPYTVDIQPDYLLAYLVKLQYPASPEMNLYALLGASTARGKFTMSAPGASASISKTKTAFTWGVGGDYNLNNQVSAGIEFVQYWNDVTVETNTKFSVWGAVANATYHF